MPEIIPNSIRVTGPDGDTFVIPTTIAFQRDIEIDIITDTLASNLSEVVGSAPNVRRRDFQIRGELTESVKDKHYVDGNISSNWDSNAVGWDEEFSDRVNKWGPNFENTATLIIERGGVKQEFDGIVTRYNSEQNVDNKDSSVSTINFTLEFTSVDIFKLNAPSNNNN